MVSYFVVKLLTMSIDSKDDEILEGELLEPRLGSGVYCCNSCVKEFGSSPEIPVAGKPDVSTICSAHPGNTIDDLTFLRHVRPVQAEFNREELEVSPGIYHCLSCVTAYGGSLDVSVLAKTPSTEVCNTHTENLPTDLIRVGDLVVEPSMLFQHEILPVVALNLIEEIQSDTRANIGSDINDGEAAGDEIGPVLFMMPSLNDDYSN